MINTNTICFDDNQEPVIVDYSDPLTILIVKEKIIHQLGERIDEITIIGIKELFESRRLK
jgi:hypothetical protein